MGSGASGLSPGVIGRPKSAWEAAHERWRGRGLAGRRYVYVWADGIYLQGRLEDEKQCVLVLIGATPEGRKQLLGFQAGFRESAQSWRELLVDLRGRGLEVSPELAIGDGALGFWKALDKVFPKTRRQRCRVHKTANVLNKLPKSRQRNAKQDLHQIWMAESRKKAEKALDTFAAKYQAKYETAVTRLTKDRKALLAFYEFPAEHWQHLRTTNPIESVFATVRHRTVRSKGCLSHRTALAMVFKLVTAASETWRRLNGYDKLTQVIEGVQFTDGIQADETETRAAARSRRHPLSDIALRGQVPRRRSAGAPGRRGVQQRGPEHQEVRRRRRLTGRVVCRAFVQDRGMTRHSPAPLASTPDREAPIAITHRTLAAALPVHAVHDSDSVH